MDWLKGKQVAITGRLASMTRKEAARLIAAHGGQFVPSANRQTSFLVVGQEGWPLEKDGYLTLKLQKAQKLPNISILTEEEFLSRLGAPSEGVHRRYTLAQLTNLLHVPGHRLRSWMEAGLIQPAENANGVCYFEYRQVVGAKTLCDLAQAGVSTERLKRSLKQLRHWMGDVDQPLNQLALLEKNGQLLVRLEEGLVEPSGQMQFDFSEETEQTLVQTKTAEDWFEWGCQHEDLGNLAEAAEAYRQALLLGGPDSDASFNLANVLYSLGQKEQACERYYQVVEMNQGYAEAWNNLGTVLAQLKRHEEAARAFRKAIGLGYGDSHYNLADMMEGVGRKKEAQEHWQAYLRFDPMSQWAKHARSRLG